jgi:hypothetical protein
MLLVGARAFDARADQLELDMIHAAVVTASPWSARSARSTAKLTMRAVTGGEVEQDDLVPAPGVGARGCLRERGGRRPAGHLVRLRRIGRATAVWVDAFLDAARGRSRTGPGGRPAC